MAGQTINEVRTQKMIRLFMQQGGASPNNPLSLEGISYGYSAIKGRTRQVRGGVTNISARNPTGPGFINVGSSESNPGYDEFELDMYELQGGIPLASVLDTCPVALYEINGTLCDQLSDALQGYAGGYIRVYQDAVIDQSVDYGDGMAYTDDNVIEAKIKMKSRGGIFDHGQIYAAALATANSADLATVVTTGAVYGNQQQCANCGVANDGTYLKYWCGKSTTASPGAKPVIFYQLGSSTPVAQVVSSAAIAEDLVGIAVVGNYLLVYSQTGGGSSTGAYHYAAIGANGVPGTWTKVTTGFVGGATPFDIYVASPSEVYFAADSGYIYKSTDITKGVSVINAGATVTTTLSRIRGNSQLMVIGGSANTLIYSANGGISWSTFPTTPPVGGSTIYNAVDVIGAKTVWVGTSTGQLFYTLDLGLTWTEVTFSGSGTAAASGFKGVADIYFVNASEGYFVWNGPSNAKMFRTYNGGASWWPTSPAIEGLSSSYQTFGRIAAPTVGNETRKANNLIASGSSNGTIGLLLNFAPKIF